MPAKIKAASLADQALALYTDPHVYKYAELIISEGFAAIPEDGRYGVNLACFFLDVEARVHGNRQQVAAANAMPGVWESKRRIVRSMVGVELPASPPSPDTVRKWRYRWVPPRDRKKNQPTPRVPLLRECLELSITLGYKRARKLGQFPDGVEPNFADPDPRHIAVADGSYLKEYSGSRWWTDPDGEALLLNSRAQSPATAVVQDVIQTVTKNGAKHTGVNFVVVITRTPFGRVFLGVDRAAGGESHTALQIFERIIDRAGTGLHAICYDQGFTGWPVDWLMAEFGVHLITTPGARKSKKGNAHPIQRARLEAREAILRAGLGKKNTTGVNSSTSKALARKRLRKQLRNWDRRVEDSRQGVPLSQGEPLGRSVYLSSRNQPVLVESQYHLHAEHSHDLPNGQRCEHPLYVDDGALWEVHLRDGVQIKAQRPRAITARRTPNPKTGAWNLTTHYQLVCTVTGEILDVHTTWQPRHKRLSVTQDNDSSKHRRKKADQALAAMQPLARCDAGFRAIYGLRLDIESFFAWFKTRILADKRAASLDLNHQLLDILYAGIVTNALALRVKRLSC